MRIVRHLGRAGQQVVGERGGERLALRVEGHLLVERGADALRRAAEDLAVDDHRVDQHAAVLDDDVVEDLDLAGLGIDRDDGGVRGVAEGAGVALGLVAGGHFEAAGIDVGRQVLRAAVPGARDLGDGDAARRPDHLAALEAHVLAAWPAAARRRSSSTRVGQLVAGRGHGAARHDHAARAPGAGGVGRLRGVAVHQADAVVRHAEDRVRDLRQRGLQALAVAVRADPQLQPAVGREARLRTARSPARTGCPRRRRRWCRGRPARSTWRSRRRCGGRRARRAAGARAPCRSRWRRWRGAGPRDSRRSRSGAWRCCRTASARAAPGS